MANHVLAINTFLDNGLKHRDLDNILASNCVVDWFGRTFIGHHKIVSFYLNSNTTYEHSMNNVEETEAIEERPYHFLTREQPLENMKIIPELSGDEQWFDCETHSPVDVKKDGQRTPIHKVTPAQCPSAPCRPGLKFKPLSDDELESSGSDDDLDESGVRPLDSSVKFIMEKKSKSPASKRPRRQDIEQEIIAEPRSPAESKYSDLHYLQATGIVTIKRQGISDDEPEKRECHILISYRLNKEDSSKIQIALIVYKSNSKNPTTRRNLIFEFEDKASELESPIIVNIASTSRCRTAVKDRKKYDERMEEISTAPAGTKYSKAIKRPMTKTSLRF